MDLNSIKDQVSNLSLYDLKAGVRKVQNAVMNYTEMEAKVREATNNEPWGASSTLMQEIANGTHSYHLLNEIMPMIYKRFTEKAAEEWRQIYKALQLLEFLVKNGSERVIDDARSHLSLLKMLRQFHYIDQNGKDQGLNVRNRSKELAELLSDVERIRAERKKARSNRNKFGGVEGGAMSGGLSGGSRYGGFGSEEAGYGGYSGGVYGDGGGFGGRDPDFQDTSSRRDRFEEYDEHDEDGSGATPRRRANPSASASVKKAEPPKPKEPEVDFLSFDDDVPPETPPKEFASNSKRDNGLGGLGSLQSAATEEDDFDDFQSATPTTTTSSKPSMSTSAFSNLPGIAAPQPMAPPLSTVSSLNIGSPAPITAGTTSAPPAGAKPNYNISSPPAPNYNIDLSSPLPETKPFAAPQQPGRSQPQQPRPTGYQASRPNYFTSVQAPQPSSQQPTSTTPGSRPTISSTASFSSTNNSAEPAAKPAAGGGGGDAFGSLWSTASSNAGIKKTSLQGTQGPNLASLQREKATQGLWGAAAAPSPPQGGFPMGGSGGNFGGQQSNGQKQGGGSGLDDLLG